MNLSKSISEKWTAIGALAGSFGAGGFLVLLFGGFVGLPAEVDAIDSRVTVVESQVDELQDDIETLVCIITRQRLDMPVEDCVS